MTAADALAAQLADLNRRLTALERSSQLSRSSVDDGNGNALSVVDGIRNAFTAASDAAAALQAATDAQSAVDGKVTVFYLDRVPGEPVGDGVELLTNGDFHTDLAGWTFTADASATWTYVHWNTASGSCYLIGDGTADATATQSGITVTAGAGYTLKVAAMGDDASLAAGTEIYVAVEWLDASGTALGTDTSAHSLVEDWWNVYTGQFTAPAGAAKANVSVALTAGTNCGAWIDDVSFQLGTIEEMPERGDFWIDTAHGNKGYTYDGGSWQVLTSQATADALAAAQDAQSTADGKIVSYWQSTAPTGAATGDLWYDTANDNRVSWWDGSAWQLMPVGSAAIADNAITADKIHANAIDGKVITGSTIQTAASGARMVMDASNTLKSYNASNKQIMTISPTDASINITGSVKVINASAPSFYTFMDGGSLVLDDGVLDSGLTFSVSNGSGAIQPTGNIISPTNTTSGTSELQLRGESPDGTKPADAYFNCALTTYRGITAGDVIQFNASDGKYYTVLDVYHNWTTASLASGYSHNGNDNGTVAYRLIKWGTTKMLQLRGGVSWTSSGNPPNGGTVFTLPSDCRPGSRRSFAAAAGGDIVKIDVNTNGTVNIVERGSSTLTTWCALNSPVLSL